VSDICERKEEVRGGGEDLLSWITKTRAIESGSKAKATEAASTSGASGAVTVTKTGPIDAIGLYYELHLDDEIPINTGPLEGGDTLCMGSGSLPSPSLLPKVMLVQYFHRLCFRSAVSAPHPLLASPASTNVYVYLYLPPQIPP